MDKGQFAIEALKMSQSWSLWLMSIQIATIGFLGLLFKDEKYKFRHRGQRLCFFLTFIFFFISILFANMLQGGIPSLASRLVFLEDISKIPYDSIFYLHFPRNWSTSLVLWGHLQTGFFILGIITFSITMYLQIKK